MKNVTWDAGRGVMDISGGRERMLSEGAFKMMPGREVAASKDGAIVRLRLIEEQMNGTWRAAVVNLDDGDSLPAGLSVDDEVGIRQGQVQTYL